MSNYEYGGNSIALEVAIKQIKLYKDALELCPKVMEVIRKFDGKVANKRLETALKEVNAGLRCNKSSYTEVWEIVFYTSDRCVNVKRKSWDGKREDWVAYYIKESEAYLARDMFKNTFGSFINEDGRWIAENINKQIEHTMKSLEANIADYTELLNHVDELEAEKKRIKDEMEAHNKKVGWIGNEYFGLKV